nr:MAG TPA: hypothetical protein [Caudoviricetes sp.]
MVFKISFQSSKPEARESMPFCVNLALAATFLAAKSLFFNSLLNVAPLITTSFSLLAKSCR